MAFGYISSKTSSNLLKTKLNIPLILTLSILPDIDILFPFIQHRGPTHSIVTAIVAFSPFFIIYRKQVIPYFIAYVQHGLVGDFLAGGRVQLLWPLSNTFFGTNYDIRSLSNMAVEWVMFIAAALLLVALKDYKTFFKAHRTSLILAVPIFTVLLPTMLSFPLNVPLLLIPPHLFYLILFSTAIILELAHLFSKVKPTKKREPTTPQAKLHPAIITSRKKLHEKHSTP